MKRVAFYTLGCKMNIHETAYMEEQFREKGYKVVDFNEVADIYIVNTCTVTHTADAKSRKALRKAAQKNPKALIVATGCYSEVYPEEVEKLPEVSFITGNAEKNCMVELVEKRLKGELPRTFIKGVWKEETFYPLTIRHYEGKTRAFLKVQQGCELFCSYCIIPKARGRMVSEKPEEVVRQARELVEAGYKEIVLTGTHLGAYGIDSGSWNLAKLLQKLTQIQGLYRIRLSSIEPMEFTDELIDVLQSEKIAPHFHIPLQSGSDRVLELMNRRYRARDYEKVVEKLLLKIPECCIGTDVMVGFPGETEKEFKETKNLIKAIPFGYLHVFPYSRRRGTAAYHLKETVSPAEKKKRAEILREIGKEKSISYRKQFLGRELEVLVLSELKEEKSIGLTGNYINMILDRKLPAGEVRKAKLVEVGEKREENYGHVTC